MCIRDSIDSPAGLGLELRSYQKEGLAWLQFLRQQKLSGILADDMGPVSYTHLDVYKRQIVH